MRPIDPKFYTAFISYRHIQHDRACATRIFEALEAYRTPRSLWTQGFSDRLGKLFRDEDESCAGETSGSGQGQGLKAALIPVSPTGLVIRWTADPSKLRPVARLDFGLRLGLAQFRLVVDHLADAGQHRALDLHIG